MEVTAKLKSLHGKAFDKFYIDNEVAYHKQVTDAIAGVLIPNAQNAELKAALEGAQTLFSVILSMQETCKPPLTPPQHTMQRTTSKNWRYNQGDIAMNAPHSSMRSVASRLILTTLLLLLVSCSLGTQTPAGGFVLAAVPKGPQTHTVVVREIKFQPAVLKVKVGDTVRMEER